MTELEREVSDALARAIVMYVERDVFAHELLPQERAEIARAVIPVVREDCAKVAEDSVFDDLTGREVGSWCAACEHIAAALREGRR